MRNTFLASAIALTLGLGAFGAASAQSASVDVELELLMETQCSLAAARNFISAQIDGVIDQTTTYAATESGYVDVLCNAELPFTVEVNTDEDGIIYMTGATTGAQVPVAIYQDVDAEQPWGSGSLARAGVGIGDWDTLDFQARFNEGPNQAWMPIPEADTYNTTLTFTVNY